MTKCRMDYISHLHFQISKLGYSFKNIDLLTEALTHSTGKNGKRKSQSLALFPPQNKTFDERLLAIGNNVLKLIVCQYCLQVSPVTADEGDLTVLKEKIMHINKLNQIGEKLLSIDDEPFVYLRTNLQNRSKLLNKNVYFGEFLKSVFAAIFIDAGGTEDGEMAITTCEKVFRHLWANFLDFITTDFPDEDCETEGESGGNLKPLGLCFFVPDEIRKFWLSQYDRIKSKEVSEKMDFVTRLCEINLEIKFDNMDLLTEAITHKTFYDPVRNNPIIRNLHQPDFQRLEFLGDSVIGVVVSEYLYYTNPNFGEKDQPYIPVGERFDKFVSSTFQGQIAEKYFMKKFVKIREDINWKRHHQIIESIIGGLYVDGGIRKAKEFIWREWNFTQSQSISRGPTLTDLEVKLGYKFQDDTTLIYALTHESVRNSDDPFWSKVGSFEPMGKHLIQLYATDYVIRTSSASANKSTLESHRNYLCGQAVMRHIAEFLDLKSHVRMANHLKHGTSPFQRYEEFINRVFAAAYIDSTDVIGGPASDSDLLIASLVIQEMFCRLWNPYLKQCPKRILEELFPPAFESQRLLREKLGCTISNEIPTDIEKCMIYTFTHRQLLQQALTDRKSRFYSPDPNIGDTIRFQVIGEAALNFSISAGRFGLHLNNLVCKSFEETRAYHLRLLPYDYDLLKKYYVVPPGTNIDDLVNNEMIALSLLGAMYVDSSGNAIFRMRQIYCYFTNLLMFFTFIKERLSKTLELDVKMEKENFVVSCATSQRSSTTNSAAPSPSSYMRLSEESVMSSSDYSEDLSSIPESLSSAGKLSMQQRSPLSIPNRPQKPWSSTDIPSLRQSNSPQTQKSPVSTASFRQELKADLTKWTSTNDKPVSPQQKPMSTLQAPPIRHRARMSSGDIGKVSSSLCPPTPNIVRRKSADGQYHSCTSLQSQHGSSTHRIMRMTPTPVRKGVTIFSEQSQVQPKLLSATDKSSKVSSSRSSLLSQQEKTSHLNEDLQRTTSQPTVSISPPPDEPVLLSKSPEVRKRTTPVPNTLPIRTTSATTATQEKGPGPLHSAIHPGETESFSRRSSTCSISTGPKPPEVIEQKPNTWETTNAVRTPTTHFNIVDFLDTTKQIANLFLQFVICVCLTAAAIIAGFWIISEYT